MRDFRYEPAGTNVSDLVDRRQEGWKADTINKTEKSTNGTDARYVSAKGRAGPRIYLTTFNGYTKLKPDRKSIMSDLALSDYDLQDALQAAEARERTHHKESLSLRRFRSFLRSAAFALDYACRQEHAAAAARAPPKRPRHGRPIDARFDAFARSRRCPPRQVFTVEERKKPSGQEYVDFTIVSGPTTYLTSVTSDGTRLYALFCVAGAGDAAKSLGAFERARASFTTL